MFRAHCNAHHRDIFGKLCHPSPSLFLAEVSGRGQRVLCDDTHFARHLRDATHNKE